MAQSLSACSVSNFFEGCAVTVVPGLHKTEEPLHETKLMQAGNLTEPAVILVNVLKSTALVGLVYILSVVFTVILMYFCHWEAGVVAAQFWSQSLISSFNI